MIALDKRTLRARTAKRTKVVAALGAAALAASLLCATRDAHAFEVRIGAHAGGQAWIPASSALSGRNAAGLVRAELNFSLIPWLFLGGYGQALTNFGDAPVAGGAGLAFSVRPTIPLSPVHPFAYASVGYAGFPGGPGTVLHWADVSLGGGLTAMMSRAFGFEARVAASKMFLGPPGEQAGPFAFMGTVGFTLHL